MQSRLHPFFVPWFSSIRWNCLQFCSIYEQFCTSPFFTSLHVRVLATICASYVMHRCLDCRFTGIACAASASTKRLIEMSVGYSVDGVVSGSVSVPSYDVSHYFSLPMWQEMWSILYPLLKFVDIETHFAFSLIALGSTWPVLQKVPKTARCFQAPVSTASS